MTLQRINCINSLKDNKIENHYGINVQEISFLNKFNLRINNKNSDLVKKCGKILNTILPIKPNTYNKSDSVNIIWLGPNEWLITNDKETDVFIQLRSELDDLEASVTDISENRTIIRISGNKIFKLLSKFLVLDLDKNLSDESSCAQTLFVKVPILLVRNFKENETPKIDIYTNRSHANYIYNLIVDGTINLDF
tara:strand:+ start:61 stop:642 length:582 start_codon:yes stop_codon:yes gene_type:complete